MTVQSFVQPNASVQTANAHPGIVDAAISVLARIGDNFAPHAGSTPNMTVMLDPGHVLAGSTLVERGEQATGAITAPTANPRIDRVVIDNGTGIVSVVTGAEAAAPVAPAIPTGKSPVAQVALQPGTTAITNAIITDERDFSGVNNLRGGLLGVQTFTTSGIYTPPAGTQRVIVEAVGGGGSGGGAGATSSDTVQAASGGGAGAYAKGLYTTGFSGVTVTVGVGGAAKPAGAFSGNVGGTTSFGNLMICPGGSAGIAIEPTGAPFVVGNGGGSLMSTGGNIINSSGAPGAKGLALGTYAIGAGDGGNSVFGGGAQGRGFSPGSAGLSPGSGGSGSPALPDTAARSGGAGANGLVIVYAYG